MDATFQYPYNMTSPKSLQSLLFDINGEISGIPRARVLVPQKVWLDGTRLQWSDEDGFSSKRPGPRLLEDFLDLGGDTNLILAFARTWGPLGVETSPPGEELETWKKLASQAAALLGAVRDEKSEE